MNRLQRTRSLTSIAVGAVLTWTTSAWATPDFPAVVVQALGLDAGITIDPPLGCTLCHTTDSGGTTLRPFGQLLQQDGCKAYDETSLKLALMQVANDDPQFIADIQGGRDPNTDTNSGNLHSPEYGCRIPAGSVGAPRAMGFGALAAMGALVLRRGARRRPAETRPRRRPAAPE